MNHSASARPRIIYILPNDDAATASHFFHISELLTKASSALDILLVVERPDTRSLPSPFPVYRQRLRLPPLRFLELLFVLAFARISGRRHCYTHYSLYGGVASWFAIALTGGRSYYWNCGMPWNYRRSWIAERVFRFVLRRNTLVTGTPGLAREYSERYGLRPDRVRVLPNWINLARFASGSRDAAREALGIPPSTEMILFVHRLSRRKGAHLLPDIAARIAPARPRGTLYIVGDGPERKVIEADIRARGLVERARFAGAIPNKDIALFFQAADMLLMPSEEEGFPRVLLEAMAIGVPFVAARVGGVSEIVPPEFASFVVPAGNPEAFAEKSIELLGVTGEERRSLGEIERAWVRRYDLSEVMKIFIDLFR